MRLSLTWWRTADPASDPAQPVLRIELDRQFVHSGAASVAFHFDTDLSKTQGKTSWPMVRRLFEPMQDFSRYEALEFWLCADSAPTFPELKLKGGFCFEGRGLQDEDIFQIAGIPPGQWQKYTVRMNPDRDWSKVSTLDFYIATNWYPDKTKVNFHINDLVLGGLTVPRFHAIKLVPRVYAGQETADADVDLEGPVSKGGYSLAWKMLGGPENAVRSESGSVLVTSCYVELKLPARPLAVGKYSVEVGLQDARRAVLDSRKLPLERLPAGKHPYFMLVPFYTEALTQAKAEEQLKLLNKSAYDGVACPITSPYDVSPVPTLEELRPLLEKLKTQCRKDIWPWFFSKIWRDALHRVRRLAPNSGNPRFEES